jgi:hypothetical protein
MSTKRWLDEGSGARELERELLRAGLDADPPRAAETLVFERLRATLGPGLSGDGSGPALESTAGPAASTAGGIVATNAATLTLFAKGVVLGVGFSLAAVGGNRWLERSPARAPESRASVEWPIPTAAEQPAAPGATQPTTAESKTPSLNGTAVPAPAPAVPRGSPRSQSSVSSDLAAARPVEPVATTPSAAVAALTSVSQLREEAAMLARARDELRTGALAAAFATLEAARRRFSAPELVQEREALGIELLYRSGETAAAGQRARAFLERFPESPHAARVRGFVAGAP